MFTLSVYRKNVKKSTTVILYNHPVKRTSYACYKIYIVKENLSMKNESIKCTIKSCTHHAKDENYCSLDHILVGTHEANPTEKACTDCESFELKKGCC